MNEKQTSALETYQTKDIYLATILKQSGIPIFKVLNNGRGQGIFIFKFSKEIEELIAKFFNKELLVEPSNLFEVWKSLKAMAFSSIGDVR